MEVRGSGWTIRSTVHAGGGNSDEQQSIGTRISGLSGQVENIFSVPVKVDSGDCMLVIYGRTGNGATDNETQVHAVMGP